MKKPVTLILTFWIYELNYDYEFKTYVISQNLHLAIF